MYSIQTNDAYNHALALGFFEGNIDFIDINFLQAYKWMRKQMKKRLKKYDNSFPIWLWPQRPDLRQAIYAYERDRDHVLLEITVDEDEILGSDFDAWHYVLNKWVLGYENESIDIEKSWERIFDYDFLKEFDNRKIEEQYVVGKVDISRIKLISKFRTKKSRHCT